MAVDVLFFGALLFEQKIRRLAPNFPAHGKGADQCTIRLPKRQTFFHAGDHRLMNVSRLSQFALPLRTLRRGEVTKARLAPHNLAGAGDLEPFGHGLFRFSTGDGLRHGAGKLAVRFRMAILF
jgi:hypothetical protein